MNDTITTPETPSLTTARSQPQILEKSTAVDPVAAANRENAVIEPQPGDIRDLPASLVNEKADQAPADEQRGGIWGKVNQLEAEHNALAKAFMELQAKLARHFPALF